MAVLLLLFLVAVSSFGAVVESEGEGCSSDIKKAKKEALENARVGAVEKHIGVLVSSKTLIINSRFARDIIQTRALGKTRLFGSPVYSKPVLSGKDNLCVKVKAKFEVPDRALRPADLGLVLLINQKDLKAGQELVVEISSEKPCYPYLFSVDAKGRVFRLLPNRVENISRLSSRVRIPTERMRLSGYVISVVPLKGIPTPQREELLFVCTKKKVKSLEEFFPSAFAEDPESLKKILSYSYSRNIKKFNEVLTQIGSENYDMVSDYYMIH